MMSSKLTDGQTAHLVFTSAFEKGLTRIQTTYLTNLKLRQFLLHFVNYHYFSMTFNSIIQLLKGGTFYVQ